MATLTLVSLMADNAEFLYRAITGYLGERMGINTSLVTNVPWRERGRMLDAGVAQVGFICGLPYVRQAESANPMLAPLAAPVLADQRYGNKAVYFSNVIVRCDSAFHSFADLRGAAWAYNEPGSFSGYAVVRAHLATLGETAGYFGRAVESGAHQASVRMVLAGEADASAIDSTVLAFEMQQHPELAEQLRVVASLGPSPIPPVVVRRDVPATLQEEVRAALLGMHEDVNGRGILASGGIARFVAVHDRDYDDIRRKARLAEDVKLTR